MSFAASFGSSFIPIVVTTAISLGALGCADENASAIPQPQASRVQNTVVLESKTLVRLRTSRSTLLVTPEHPFARVSSGWTPAGKLAPGDVVVSAGSTGSMRIEGVETLNVPPTPVYNLTVSPGHAYFVGADRLLVHNTDCSRRREPIQVNDMPEFEGHCAFCTLAALADMSVAELTDTRDILPDNDGVTPTQFRSLLRRTGAITEETHATMWRQPAEGRAATSIPQVLERFITEEHGQCNTFALIYSREGREERPPRSGHFVTTTTAHAITAVRLDDGATVYIDFQERPPLTSRSLNPDIQALAVWPTTTDYRYNRHMLSALRYGRSARVIL